MYREIITWRTILQAGNQDIVRYQEFALRGHISLYKAP